MKEQTLRIIIGVVAVFVITLIFFTLPAQQNTPSNFEECVAAGGPVMESYPRQCRANGQTFVEEQKPTPCRDEERNVDVCIEIYEPVCAKVNIQCITTPCDPVQETISNACHACRNPLVESYTAGPCQN